MTTTEITKGQRAIATVVGVHNASTGVVIQPTVKGAKFLGRKLKSRYTEAKDATVQQFAHKNATKPIQADEVVTQVPQGATSF